MSLDADACLRDADGNPVFSDTGKAAEPKAEAPDFAVGIPGELIQAESERLTHISRCLQVVLTEITEKRLEGVEGIELRADGLEGETYGVLEVRFFRQSNTGTGHDDQQAEVELGVAAKVLRRIRGDGSLGRTLGL